MTKPGFTLMLAALIIAGTITARASTLSAEDVLNRARSMWEGESFYGTISLDITMQSQTESYLFEVWTQGTERALLRFQAPKDREGEAYLQVENDLWYYSPELGNAIQLPSIALGEAVLGAGPSLDDLLRKTLTEDYEVTMSDDEGGGYSLTLVPHPDAPVVYGELKMRVNADFSLKEIVYYDQRGEIIRTTSFASYLRIDDRVIPTLITVEGSDGDRTVEHLEKVQFGIALPTDFFTVQNLENR